MSTSIHGSIEYRHTYSPIVFTFADVNVGVSMSNIFGRLGAKHHNEARTAVPVRGWPKNGQGDLDCGSGFRTQAAALVVRGSEEAGVDFDENGHCREVDGLVITEEAAEKWLASKHFSNPVEWLDADWRSNFRYISDPDIHSVNWITADELSVVIEKTSKELRTPDGREGGFLGGYHAVVAAMRALEQSPSVEASSVRFIYGFDN